MRNTWSREFRQQLCPTLYSPIASVGRKKEEVRTGDRYKKRKLKLFESGKLLLHIFSHPVYRPSILVRPEGVQSILMLLKQITFIFVWQLTGKIQVSLDYDTRMSPSSSIFSPLITHLNIKLKKTEVKGCLYEDFYSAFYKATPNNIMKSYMWDHMLVVHHTGFKFPLQPTSGILCLTFKERN